MLNDYLNQAASLQHSTGTDDRGQTTHGPVQAVRCRKQRRGRVAVANQHATRVQETIYYLLVPVAEGDILDGKLVLTVNDWVGLGGSTAGYKAVV